MAFKLFLAGQTLAFMAYNMISVAVGWQVYDLTRSPFLLGMVGLAQFLPQLLCTLPAGHVADRFDRRRVVAACVTVELATAAALAAANVLFTPSAGLILACACLTGAARAFEMPAMQALLPSLVDRGDLPRCLALAASGRQTASMLGPALGGVVYLAGPALAYGVCALLSGAGLVAFAFLRGPKRQGAVKAASLATMFEGVAFIRSKPDILGAISLDLFSVLLGGATALLPLYARDILHTGSWGLGLLRAAPAVGALAMSLWLARRPLGRRVGRTMFAAVAGFGLATVVFGLSRVFFLSLAALVFLGACDMISVVVRSSLVQLETPDDKRGRVSAVNSIFIGASNQLGEFESGVTAALFGAVPAVVLGGVCTLIVAVVWMRLFPSLAGRDTLDQRTSPRRSGA